MVNGQLSLLDWKPPPPRKGPGVDLSDPEAKGLVDRIYRGRWAYRAERKGMDPDDLLGMVYRGILARNLGVRPFDPRVSSLSNYAYIVIGSVFKQELDKHTRSNRRNGVPSHRTDAALLADGRPAPDVQVRPERYHGATMPKGRPKPLGRFLC